MHSMTFLMTNMTFDDDLFVFCFKKTLKSIIGGLNVCKKHSLHIQFYWKIENIMRVLKM